MQEISPATDQCSNSKSGIWQLLERSASAAAKRTAIGDGERSLDYGQWFARCRSLAESFFAMGLRPGDRLAIYALNREEYLSCYFAAAGAGLILVPLNNRLTNAEIRSILFDSGASLVLGLDDWAFEEEKFRRLLETEGADFEPHPAADEEVAQIYYTSGTTGKAKGVQLTHGNVLSHARMTIDALQLRESDTWGHIAPLFHLADAWATFAITAVGGCHVTQDEFEPEATLRLIETRGITITNLVPTMLNRMVKHPGSSEHCYDSLRMLLSGGAPIAASLVEEVIRIFGCEYVQTYGLTETSPFLTMSILPDHLRKLAAAEQIAYRAKTGRPCQGIELSIVDSAGREVAPDSQTVGEIRARGPSVSPGYWQNPEADAEAFKGGWLYTGDLAVMDGEGFVDIVDRKKDVILSGGETVYSTEVEHRLCEHPAVLEAAVFAENDPDWGERVCAAVVLLSGEQTSAVELIEFCRLELASFKTPKEVRLLESLPRTGSGKISKRQLRQR